MLDFNGQLSLAAGGVAFETLTSLTKEDSKQLMYMSAVSHQIQKHFFLMYFILYGFGCSGVVFAFSR